MDSSLLPSSLLTDEGSIQLVAHSGLPAESREPHWYAAYTRANHEKRVAEQLDRRAIGHLLPLYETLHQWKDRRVRVALPLFPGYVFVHTSLHDRLEVLGVPGVVRLVSFNGRPCPLSEADMEAVSRCLVHKDRVEPHPFLRVGRRVRVTSGPLQGLEGILVRKKSRSRLVISLHLIMRSVAVDMDALELEPAV